MKKKFNPFETVRMMGKDFCDKVNQFGVELLERNKIPTTQPEGSNYLKAHNLALDFHFEPLENAENKGIVYWTLYQHKPYQKKKIVIDTSDKIAFNMQCIDKAE